MRVLVENGDARVEIDVEGGFNPDVLEDMCHRAVRTYAEAFPDEDAEAGTA